MYTFRVKFLEEVPRKLICKSALKLLGDNWLLVSVFILFMQLKNLSNVAFEKAGRNHNSAISEAFPLKVSFPVISNFDHSFNSFVSMRQKQQLTQRTTFKKSFERESYEMFLKPPLIHTFKEVFYSFQLTGKYLVVNIIII